MSPVSHLALRRESEKRGAEPDFDEQFRADPTEERAMV
jgi:hypothetical protein